MADTRTIRTTIELSGENSYLNKLKAIKVGLQNVNSAQKVLDAQYARGDNSLAALTSRQGLYQDKLALQRQKLEAVRQEYEKVVAAEGKNSETARKLANDYNNTSAQVIRTEKDLKAIDEAMEGAARAAEDAGKSAGGAAEDVRSLGSASSTASQNLKKISDAAKEQEAALKKIGDTAEKTAAKLSKTLGAAAVAAATVGSKAYMEFENEMANVQTLADTGVKSMEMLSEEAITASNETHIAAKDIAKSAYDALSSGVDTANVMNYMTSAGKAAKAGHAELNDVVDGSTSIMNAWKIAYSESTGVFEKMLVAQDKGKTTLGQISQNIGQITGLAPQLNISLEETLAATAALTKNGVQTSSAINGLKAVMSNVLKPTAEAKEEAKRLGLEFDAAALKSKGLTGFLADVMEKTGGSSESLAKLFGSVEGLSQIMLLGGTAAADYQDALDAMADSSGRLDAAFDTVTSSRMEKMNASMNRLKNNAIAFGRSLAPYIDMAADAMGNLSVKLDGLTDEQMRGILETGLWISAALGMVGALSKISNAVKTVKTAFGAGGGWIGLAVTAITALIAGAELLNSKLPSVEKSLANLFGNNDQELMDRFDVAYNAEITTTVTVDDYQTKIDTELEKIRTALKETEGISEADRTAIIAAISEGSGLDLLDEVLAGSGITEGELQLITDSFKNAMTDISTAIEGLGLSEDAEAKIAEVAAAGGDVQAALESCGVPEGKAAEIAGTISTAVSDLDTAMQGVGLDDATRVKLITGAISDKAMIRTAMEAMGVPAGVVEDVLASYSTVAGSLTGQITGLYDQISTALTDGKPDTPAVKAELETAIREFYGGAIQDVQTWINEEIAKLDVNSDTYTADVENIKTKGSEMVAELQTQQEATLDFLTTMAGRSTEEVQARLGELGEIEAAVRKTIAEIDYANRVAGGEGAQASRITKAGAATNIETAGRAFGYEKQTRDNRLADLEEQYQADLLALESQYDALGEKEYARQAAQLEATYEARKTETINGYQKAVMDLMAGLGESLMQMNPEMAAQLSKVAENLNLADAVQEALSSIQQGTPVTAADISDDVYQQIIDSMGLGWSKMSKEQLVQRINDSMAGGELDKLREEIWEKVNSSLLGDETTAAIDGADLGFVGEAIAAAIQNGAFEGITGVDMTDNQTQIRALFSQLGTSGAEGYTEAVTTAADSAYTAGANLGAEAVSGAETEEDSLYSVGQNIGGGLVSGLNSKYSAVYAAARKLAQAAERAARAALQIRSPSRKLFKVGEYTADGMIGGLNSKTRAVQNAMQRMVNPAGLSAGNLLQSSAYGQSVNSNSVNNVNVQYSGAFTRNEAKRFGKALCDEMAAEAAARGG